MKKVYIALFFTVALVYAGHFTDVRDGQTYRTVKIGKQIWMAENLNYYYDIGTARSMCANDRCNYGRLYTWSAAMDSAAFFDDCDGCNTSKGRDVIRGVCPAGWHLPDSTEWVALWEFTCATVRNKVKAQTGIDLWKLSDLISNGEDHEAERKKVSALLVEKIEDALISEDWVIEKEPLELTVQEYLKSIGWLSKWKKASQVKVVTGFDALPGGCSFGCSIDTPREFASDIPWSNEAFFWSSSTFGRRRLVYAFVLKKYSRMGWDFEMKNAYYVRCIKN